MSGLAHTNGRGSKQALVRDEILGMLDELTVGDALPSERRLATDLGVSRPTLRAVIDELVREGLLLRRHGSGTYVAEPKIALPLTMTSFSEDMARRGMRPSSQVVSFERQSAGAKLGQRLQISPVDDVWVITRLRLADDETMAIEWLHAPHALLPDLRREELATHSFYELLRVRRGIVIASGTQTIEPTVTSPEEADLLSVPVHSPAFLFERTTQSELGEVVEFVRSVYRGDRYRLVTELRPALR
ncbi:GntR family transcriptional regulator [Solirubrobacter ginsenosidimutans]|uniref:GntR family transcriptional regulator n=1 Tax=Solirubrobacter ginsenosidimutans TaxID=490573 RepID=A0A9X3S3S5_9ACTN|nr:GntR family transcriptional regulator [Solirubrobacter ginsenosidimutans]MDA0163757.1 GntR family transcriptional regulator [Solirubrobacter ginsenosidimutans]